MTEIDDVLAELATLRSSFIADLPTMLETIERLADDVCADPEPDARQDLIRAVHSLAGTSETFGLAEIGSATRHLEDLLEAEDAEITRPCAVALATLRHLIDGALTNPEASQS
ncbi:Hpt domain-containing protein [Lichenihabitans sp. Uapishka_5]|uniref:Hpt domain-containing protein n=1 Tax=Lichenihabitans sp. Uapishka_5 TaxID=3037302 RepID=UPI0029E7E0BF|nr:Hpt domain-containing protein [Lichenihabitans sp. Uapishka_5]MDX7952360.1 Hpt domain-containing protein [Lichenihabitans sp. Uapishka_5]